MIPKVSVCNRDLNFMGFPDKPPGVVGSYLFLRTFRRDILVLAFNDITTVVTIYTLNWKLMLQTSQSKDIQYTPFTRMRINFGVNFQSELPFKSAFHPSHPN